MIYRILQSFQNVILAALLIFALVLGGCRSTTDPTWRFSYDNNGGISSATTPGGKKTVYSYSTGQDGRVRQVNRALSDGQKVSYEIDSSGRVAQMTDSNGTATYGYDGSDRLTDVRRSGLAHLKYEFDALGQLKRYAIGDAWSIAYEYDYLNRVSRVNTPIGVIEYHYETATRRRIRTFPNGIQTIWQGGPDGNLDSITHADGAGRILLQLTYSYNVDGKIQSIDEYSAQHSERRQYHYDALAARGGNPFIGERLPNPV